MAAKRVGSSVEKRGRRDFSRSHTDSRRLGNALRRRGDSGVRISGRSTLRKQGRAALKSSSSSKNKAFHRMGRQRSHMKKAENTARLTQGGVGGTQQPVDMGEKGLAGAQLRRKSRREGGRRGKGFKEEVNGRANNSQKKIQRERSLSHGMVSSGAAPSTAIVSAGAAVVTPSLYKDCRVEPLHRQTIKRKKKLQAKSLWNGKKRPVDAEQRSSRGNMMKGIKQQQQFKRARQRKQPVDNMGPSEDGDIRGLWDRQKSEIMQTTSVAAAPDVQIDAGEHHAVSVSKQRKLDAEQRKGARNQDASYIRQCFRLYGQLIAAPRSSEGEVEEPTAASAANADEGLPQTPSGQDVASSPPLKSKRSPAVQKAAAALYDFVMPRVIQKDRHVCTSRAVQMLLKYGGNEQRRALWESLKTNFPDLCMGRNSCQLAMKLYLYGDSSCQKEIVQILRDPKLGKSVFFSKCGARVWEYVYTAAKNEKAQMQMLRSIVLPPLAIVRYPEDSELLSFPALIAKFDPETRKLTLDHLASVIQSCVDKELLDKAPVHKILHWYTVTASPERLQEVMNATAQGFLHLASTTSGVEAMTALSGFATAKQRKALIKELKKHVVSMAKNAVDCVFVLRLLCTVDDTRLLREGILQPLLADVRELIVDRYGQLVLLQLLEDSAEFCRFLPPYYKRLLEQPSPTSLKPLDIRLSELRGTVLEVLETTVINSAKGPPEGWCCDATGANKTGKLNNDEKADELQWPKQQRVRGLQKPMFTLSEWLSDPKASRILTKFLQYSTSSRVFTAIVTFLLEDQQGALTYLDHPQVQRFLSGLAKHMEQSPSATGSSLAKDEGQNVADFQSRNIQAWEDFLTDLWNRLLKPQLVHILYTRGVFVVSDVLEAARRLRFGSLEGDIVGSLDSNVLSDARAKLLEKDVVPTSAH